MLYPELLVVFAAGYFCVAVYGLGVAAVLHLCLVLHVSCHCQRRGPSKDVRVTEVVGKGVCY